MEVSIPNGKGKVWWVETASKMSAVVSIPNGKGKAVGDKKAHYRHYKYQFPMGKVKFLEIS